MFTCRHVGSRLAAWAGWTLHSDRYGIAVIPRARRSCPDCRGAGGRWVSGPHPDMDACDCTDGRRSYRLPLRPRPGFPAEPPF